MHLKHRWTSWTPHVDTGDAEQIIASVRQAFAQRGPWLPNITLVDIDARHCTKCGRRQLREVKP